MAEKRVKTDAEQAKRNAVKRLIASGKGGYRDAETATAPSTDLAAAGAAAVSGDPVDLGAAAQATASAISGAPSADNQRYAEAARLIFEDQAKSRGATAMRRLGPEWETQVTATNFALDKYQKELAAAEAERKAALSRGSRRRSGSDTGGLDLGLYDDPIVSDPNRSVFDNEDETRYDLPYEAEPPPEGAAEAHVAADAFMEESWFSGLSFGGAIGQAWTFLNQFDLSWDEKNDIIADLKASWSGQWDQDDRAVVGGSDLLAPDGGFYGSIGGSGRPSRPSGGPGGGLGAGWN